MKGRIYFIILYLGFLTGISTAHSAPNIPVIKFTIEEGLSNNSVNAIFQDSRGFLWVATEDGLNRYDGYGFKVFRHDPVNNKGIAGNQVVAVSEDKSGNIWVATRDRGISVLCGVNGTIKHFRHEELNENSLPEDRVHGFFLSPDSTMWVKTRGFLSRFRQEYDDFESFGHYVNIFRPSKACSYGIVKETGNTFLVGTSDGLNRFNLEDGVFERLRSTNVPGEIFQEPVTVISGVGSGNYLLATVSGLKYFNAGAGYISRVPALGHPGGDLPVRALCTDKYGNVWVGTSRGLEKFNPERFSHEVVMVGRQAGNPLIGLEVTSIHEDSSGLIWVGTRFHGLFKLNPGGTIFSFVGTGQEDEWPLQSFNISSIIKCGDGLIWAGTAGAGLYRINTALGTYRHHVINPAKLPAGNDNIETLFEDANGNLWVGTNSGLFTIDRRFGFAREFYYGYNLKFATLLRNNNITSIKQDSAGVMWFGTRFGLYSYGSGRMQSFFEGGQGKSLLSDEVNALHVDGSGRLWIGTSRGVNFLEPGGEEFFVLKDRVENKGFDHSVTSIASDKSGKIWVGTRSGLYVVNDLENDSAFINPAPGMANEMIAAVIVDPRGNVWTSSSRGISKLINEIETRVFDYNDGLPAQVFNIGSAHLAIDGELLFGSTIGFNRVHPESFRVNPRFPEVAITSISICRGGACEPAMIMDPSRLEVRFRSGMIMEVRFAALEFTQPLKNRYRVMLQGYDNDWRPVTTSNEASFANLSPGRYTLKVMAANNDLVWNPDPKVMSIVVKPPLWMSTAAYIFYLLALIFIIQAIINYRVRHYRKANRLLNETSVDKQRLEGQSKELSRINQSLTDSIQYAKRIQSAMIPSENDFKKIFPRSFVYFKPKDLVSGDFYWFHEQRGKIFLAAVDCTGHGVPGAFMSIIGMNILKNTVLDSGSDSPAQILKALNEDLDNTLRQDNTPGLTPFDAIKDGMDIVFIVIDRLNGYMDFAGVVNGLYLVRGNEMITYKGDRLVAGNLPGEGEPAFSEVRIPLYPDDVIYLFSDGYADQFGGAEAKKFKYRRFRHLLLNIHGLAFNDQKAILHQKLEDWKGKEEQVDDVLVIGFKPF